MGEQIQAAYREQEAGEKHLYLALVPEFPVLVAISAPKQGTLSIEGTGGVQQALVPDLETGLIWYFHEREAWEKTRQR